ncbi:unnamed protein product [Strongylus vulgaris]|uniref:Uncharacterized protein n=1 Tax=Strongylus vulgaris TaxID=40348 RepID=A0A3P7IW40_STRVU|nr:unnamed protein product [Strongylus vulgaris]
MQGHLDSGVAGPFRAPTIYTLTLRIRSFMVRQRQIELSCQKTQKAATPGDIAMKPQYMDFTDRPDVRQLRRVVIRLRLPNPPLHSDREAISTPPQRFWKLGGVVYGF